MSTTILIYVICAFIVLILIWMGLTEYRIRKFFAGTKAKNLEDVLEQIGKQLNGVKETQIEINKHLMTVDQRLDKAIRSVRTKRFNPFEDAGSNQSFAMSFLNDEGNGVIISSLYARDRMSIFAKPIDKGVSTFDLTDEEKEVLDQSIKHNDK